MLSDCFFFRLTRVASCWRLEISGEELKKTKSNLNVALFEVLAQLANFLQRDRKPMATDVISDYQ